MKTLHLLLFLSFFLVTTNFAMDDSNYKIEKLEKKITCIEKADFYFMMFFGGILGGLIFSENYKAAGWGALISSFILHQKTLIKLNSYYRQRDNLLKYQYKSIKS